MTNRAIKLFPQLAAAHSTVVNLDREGAKWLADRGQPAASFSVSPLLDPKLCAKFIGELHERLKVDYTVGGYLEDRSVLWKGCYMEATKRYLHLGIDINLSAGSVLHAPCQLTIVRIDDDYPETCGWGPRVFATCEAERPGIVAIFAHLENITCNVGEVVTAGAPFASIGRPPFNGNWIPHLHIQNILIEEFDRIVQNDIKLLDGYGPLGDAAELARLYPDPSWML